MAENPSRYWRNGTVELRAAGFDPVEVADKSAIVTIASPYTNTHRCNKRAHTANSERDPCLTEP